MGDHPVLVGQEKNRINVRVKPVEMTNVDAEVFVINLREKELPTVNDDVDTSVIQVVDVLYDCVKKATCHTSI